MKKALNSIIILLVGVVGYSQTGKEFYCQGVDCYNQQNYTDAIEYFTKSIQLVPDNASSFNNRGMAKEMLRDYSGAITDYSIAIVLNPKDTSAYFNRGNARCQVHDFKGGIARPLS